VPGDTAGDIGQDRQTARVLCVMAGRLMAAGGLWLLAGQTWAILRTRD